MGAENGLALIERLEGIEGLVVIAGPDGRLEDHLSAGFRTTPPKP